MFNLRPKSLRDGNRPGRDRLYYYYCLLLSLLLILLLLLYGWIMFFFTFIYEIGYFIKRQNTPTNNINKNKCGYLRHFENEHGR